MSVLPALVRLVLSRIGWLFATGDERDAEILALRHQLMVLDRQVARPRFTETDRTILAVLSTAFDKARLGGVLLIVKPVGAGNSVVAFDQGKYRPPVTRATRCHGLIHEYRHAA